MSATVINSLLWAAAVSSGLMAGVYFAFSGFIMQAFGKLDTHQAVAAMNSINRTILRSWFMPLFFGSTVVAILLIITSVMHWDSAGSKLSLVAGAVYFLGMFVCTVVFNVPLNNALAALDPDNDDVQKTWAGYLKTWTRWNHLRTISSLLCCILCVGLLSLY